jgi:chemotaxis protein methyltransferase CheR
MPKERKSFTRQEKPHSSAREPACATPPSEPRSDEAAPRTAQNAIADAEALLEQGRPDKARLAAEEALALEPRNVQALLVRAYSHADAGSLDSAIADATSALEIDPLLAPARYVLGIIYQRAGDERAALGEFKRTIYIDHEFVLAHFNAANIYRARGAIEDACREYENTLATMESNPDGAWTEFLGGFRPDLLVKTCQRSLIECRKGL